MYLYGTSVQSYAFFKAMYLAADNASSESRASTRLKQLSRSDQSQYISTHPYQPCMSTMAWVCHRGHLVYTSGLETEAGQCRPLC